MLLIGILHFPRKCVNVAKKQLNFSTKSCIFCQELEFLTKTYLFNEKVLFLEKMGEIGFDLQFRGIIIVREEEIHRGQFFFCFPQLISRHRGYTCYRN